MTKISNQYSLTNVLFADAVNGRVGIGTASPTVALDVVGAGRFSTTVTAQTGFKLPANGNGTSPTLAFNNSLGFGVSGTGIFFGNLYNSDLSTAMQLRVTNAGGTDITAMTIESSGSSVFNANVFVRANDRGYSVQHSDGTFNAGLGNVNGSNLKTGYMYLNQNGSTTIQLHANGSSYFNGGNVGIGTSSPNERLHVSGNISVASLSGTRIGFNTSDQFSALGTSIPQYGLGYGWSTQPLSLSGYYGIAFFSESTERMRISLGGAVTINSLGSGAVTATSGVLSTTSDMTLKVDDGYIDNALDKISKLTPRYFYWKEESGLPTDIRQLGFYAQEVNQALGEEAANTPKSENDKWGIYDRGIIAMLTKAIQEISAQSSEQQLQINELKALLNA